MRGSHARGGCSFGSAAPSIPAVTFFDEEEAALFAPSHHHHPPLAEPTSSLPHLPTFPTPSPAMNRSHEPHGGGGVDDLGSWSDEEEPQATTGAPFDPTTHEYDFAACGQETDPCGEEPQPPTYLPHATLNAEPVIRMQPPPRSATPASRPSTMANYNVGAQRHFGSSAATPSRGGRGRGAGRDSRGWRGGRPPLARNSIESWEAAKDEELAASTHSKPSRGIGCGGRGGHGGRGGRGGKKQDEDEVDPFGMDPSIIGFKTTWGPEEDGQNREDNAVPVLHFDGFEEDEYSPSFRSSYQYGESAAAAAAAAAAPSALITYAEDAECEPIDVLPKEFRRFFPYSHFTRVQSKCLREAYFGDTNLVVAAPTGSGKTVIFELAILRYFALTVLDDTALKSQRQRQHLADAAEQKEMKQEVGLSPELDAEAEEDKATRARIEAQLNAESSKGGTWGHRGGRRGGMRKKCLYMAPIRAICEQRKNDWAGFGVHLGLKIVTHTGDTDIPSSRLADADIVITTPEKWDALSRRQGYHDRELMASVGLVLIDEIHLLNDPIRGATLEGMLSRMLMRANEASRDIPNASQRDPIGNLRVMALSATAPNATDVAAWLKGQPKSFTNEYRQRPLEFVIYPYSSKGNQFAFEQALNRRLFEIITRHSEGKATLVFNATRKNAEFAAKTVANEITRTGSVAKFVQTEEQRVALNNSKHYLPEDMWPYMEVGVGYHHGGLTYIARQEVERLFIATHLPVLCATTTLGQGVNLPARLVIVKGTKQWDSGTKQFVDLDDTTLMQMIGRAGRPQWDKKGVAVVLTEHQKLQQYSTLLHGRSIESHLHEHLVDHINAEIVVGRARTFIDVHTWLKSTFMYVRMHRDPRRYFHTVLTPALIDSRVEDLARSALESLLNARMLAYDEDGVHFQGTPLAFLTARWYLSFRTAGLLNAITPKHTFEDLLDLFAQADEFADSDIRIKPGDKGVLNPFLVRHRRRRPTSTLEAAEVETVIDPATGREIFYDKPKLPYPIGKGHITSQADKVKALVQFRCVGLTDALREATQRPAPSLITDMVSVMGTGARIARAIDEYIRHTAKKEQEARVVREAAEAQARQSSRSMSSMSQVEERVGWVALKAAIQFRKAIVNQCFENTPQMFVQLQHVGPVHARHLFVHVRTFADVARATDAEIGAWTGGKKLPEQIREQVQKIPLYQIRLHQQGFDKDWGLAIMSVTFDYNSQTIMSREAKIVHLFIGTLRNEVLFYSDARLPQLPITRHLAVRPGTQVRAFAIDDQTVGADVDNTLYLRYGENVDKPMDTNTYALMHDQLHRCFNKMEQLERPFAASETNEASHEEEGVQERLLAPMDDEEIARSTAAAATNIMKAFCKHKMPKCLAGQCKHTCCQDRYRANRVPRSLASASHDASGPASASSPVSYFERRPGDPEPSRFGDSRDHADEAEDGDFFPARDTRKRSAAAMERTLGFSFDAASVSSAFSRATSIKQTNPFRAMLDQERGAVGEDSSSLVTNKRVRLAAPSASLPHPSNASHWFEQVAEADMNRPPGAPEREWLSVVQQPPLIEYDRDERMRSASPPFEAWQQPAASAASHPPAPVSAQSNPFAFDLTGHRFDGESTAPDYAPTVSHHFAASTPSNSLPTHGGYASTPAYSHQQQHAAAPQAHQLPATPMPASMWARPPSTGIAPGSSITTPSQVSQQSSRWDSFREEEDRYEAQRRSRKPLAVRRFI